MANPVSRMASGRQYPLFAEVVVDVADIPTTGTTVTAIRLPFGAQVISGAVITEVAFDAATATLGVGHEGTPSLYGAPSIAAVGRVALNPTGLVTDGADIRVTATYADPVTVGRARVQVMYVIANRANEAQTN